MKMKMLVRIDMIQLKAGGGKSLELSGDLRRQLRAHLGQKEHCRARPRHVGAEMTGPIHQIGHGIGGQHGLSFHQHQMQSDAKFRHGLGAGHGVMGARARNHQAGGRENAVLMGTFDRFIDFESSAKIIGSDDELLHWP